MKKVVKFLLFAAVFTGIAVSDSTSFTVHVIGDSTVQTYKDDVYPQTGWGQILGSFFDGSRVQVVNHAIGGRSSKTFIQYGRLNAAADQFQKGDVVLVQFGHNDRYLGENAANKQRGRQVPFDSLGGYLQQYVDAAKSKGATPIFVTPMNMNMGANGRNVFIEYNVVGKMEELAKKNGVPYVNLNAKSYNAYSKSWNPAYVSRYQFKMILPKEYPIAGDTGIVNDNGTHFQESGSIAHCQWIAEELESALKNESYISSEDKANLTQLVASLKPRYAFTVKANISNSNGLITHNQELPGGVPLTLHVSPGSFGKKFQGWYDDDCNLLSTDSNYYGKKTLYRAATYTAIFEGGAACSKTAHGEEHVIDEPKSSSSVAAESSNSIDKKLCMDGSDDAAWPSPIELSDPDAGDGWTETNHDGYSGIGFFNLDNRATSKAVYNVTSNQSASNARVMVRYAFAGNSNRDMKITIDNGIYDVAFPPTGGWDKWDTVYIDDVWVDALDFVVTLASTTDDGGPNIDMIAFNMNGVYRTGCETEISSSSAADSLETESDSLSAIVVSRSAPRVFFNARAKSIETPGGLLDVQLMNALGKTLRHESRMVPRGVSALLAAETDIPRGRYFVQIRFNGKVVAMQPVKF